MKALTPTTSLFLFLSLFLFNAPSAFSQDNGKDSNPKVNRCRETTAEAHRLVPKYHSEGKSDSLNCTLKRWQEQCGGTEEVLRCHILWAIETNHFSEDLYKKSVIDHLLEYKNPRGGYYANGSNQFTNKRDTLTQYTMAWASQLLEREDLTPLEVFFAKTYSDPNAETFPMLVEEEYDSTEIQEHYQKAIRPYQKPVIANVDFLVGTWIPTEDLSVVGNQFLVGVRAGFRHKMVTVSPNVSFMFGGAPNTYQVHQNDSLWNTTRFFGGYIGLDLGVEVYSLGRHRFEVVGGAGYMGFEALNESLPTVEGDVTKSINSASYNVGIGYRFFMQLWSYVGCDFKYNIATFDNPLGTSLNGNVYTLSFYIGLSGNSGNIQRLQELEMDDYYREPLNPPKR